MILGRLMRYGSFLSFLLVAAWLAGFFLFVGRVTAYIEPAIGEEIVTTDAIVVLTGGSERVSAGLELLHAGKAKKLLISGVYQKVTPDSLLQINANIPHELMDCCVVLGREADNTIGNAAETQEFMRKEGFKTLRLVTAHYHMPRSLYLFSKAMPDVKIYLYPVSPDTVDLLQWWRRPGTLSLLAYEYCKYLFVRAYFIWENF